MAATLERYKAKRNFGKTPEPAGEVAQASERLAFVIQKHAASRLHYDFRLELDGVMLSWAVPKGPSYDPTDKRMAVQVEDHPVSYNRFEGTIPRGQYGAGTVIIWDRGHWQPVGDPRQGLADGKLLFTMHGEKMFGLWELVRIRPAGAERQDPWLLFKKRDRYARPRAEYDVVAELPDSVVSKPLAPRPPSAADAPAAAATPAVGRKAALPAVLKPQLATLASALPTAGDWLYEIKFDGYRLMARIEHGQARLITRGGHDWSERMPDLVEQLGRLGLSSGWLDGEIVVMGPSGAPDFNALQNAFKHPRANGIVYFVFDLPFAEGRDLRKLPLRERRALLQQCMQAATPPDVRLSETFDADPASLMQSACALGLEGVIAKRADAPYVSERSETWLKLKCKHRQEFVIGGYTDRGDLAQAAEVGSLLLGVHDDAGALVSVGSVGTGWNAETAADIKRRLVPLRTEASPFASHAAPKRGRWSRRSAGSERWVQPVLLAEVSFGEWTPDGQIRHAVFEGLRHDKPAREITREDSTAVKPAPAPAAKPARSSRTQVSNPGRVIDAASGITKIDLVRYYASVAEHMLPHLRERPCSLVRAPSGVGGNLFFQKHAEKLRIPDVVDLDPALWPGHQALLEVPSALALTGAAQMNVIEFHTWNAKVKAIGKPDRMVFDLDPGEGVAWDKLQEAAVLMRTLLTELGLQSWLKTSGGKGLHVVVPIAPRQGWDAVKGFSQAVVQHLARVIPDRFVAKSGPANRLGKIFVDYLRNGHGATTAAAFSARARPGLGVSMPVDWSMLPKLKSGAHWTVATAREHLSFQTDDPWAAYWNCRQPLGPAMKALGYKPPPAG